MAKKLEKINKITVNGRAHINTAMLGNLIHKRVTAKKTSSCSAIISTADGFTNKDAEKCAIALGGVFNGRFISVKV